MAYYLTAFNGVTFPLIQPLTEMPTAFAMPGTVATLGGGFDAWGSDTAPAQFPVQIQYRVTVASQTASTFVSAINAIRALGRSRGTLTRTDQNGGTQTATARLLEISALDSVETFSAIELTLTFEVWTHWGSTHTASPTTLTGSPQTVVITNAGNINVDDAIVTVTAGDAALTVIGVDVSGTGWRSRWIWTGTLAAGAALVVNAGEWSVKNAANDAYAGFVFQTEHTLAGMFRLAPGANNVAVGYTGGGAGSTINVTFANAWA
jgi:hypothetical protein